MSGSSHAAKPLDDSAVARCAALVATQPSDGFAADLRSLIALAWRFHTPGQRARRSSPPNAAARAQVVRTGRTFLRALKSAPLEVTRPIELGLPFGSVYLAILLDEIAASMSVKRGPQAVRFRHEQFVILLFQAVKRAKGATSISTNSAKRFNGLLNELRLHLPPGFLLATYTADILRRLRNKEKGMRWPWQSFSD